MLLGEGDAPIPMVYLGQDGVFHAMGGFQSDASHFVCFYGGIIVTPVDGAQPSSRSHFLFSYLSPSFIYINRVVLYRMADFIQI